MVSYDTEAILINAFGDEWGGGELWDLYESIENPKQFFAIFAYIAAGVIFLFGATLLGFHFLDKKRDHLLIIGISLIAFSIIILVGYHFL